VALLVLLSYRIGNTKELDWSLCGPPSDTSAIEGADVLDPDTPVQLKADRASFNEKTGKGLLIGNVEALRGNQQLRAEQIQYFEQEALIRALGGVTYSDEDLYIRGPEAELSLDDDSAQFLGADFRYIPRHGRGEAGRIFRKSKHVVELEEASYTTCNLGKDDWLIEGDRLILDRETGDGTARDVLLRLQNVPVFYLPWLRFPIDDRRKSGFLAPTIGTTSNSGTQIIVPYYWNMAPNRDAIISPRVLSDRGLQLKTQFRYLYHTNRGNMDLEYIRDLKSDKHRHFISLKDKNNFLPQLTGKIIYNRASDKTYFEDFGNSLSQTSISHLRQQAEVLYSGSFWNLLTRVQNFQTIDDEIAPLNRPYERLPQLLFRGRLPELTFGLDTSVRAEWVRFERNSGITGDRLDTSLNITLPYVTPGFFANSSVGVQTTAYNLRNTDGGADDMPTRGLPIANFDTGLIFERPLYDSTLLQTLEPRLFYLYVPFRDQSEIPTFDTARLDFNMSQLFRTNRFSGGDRVGDANQLSVALTSRLVDTKKGHELLNASIGQIYYFSDRRVTLPGRPVEDTDSSDLITELNLRLADNWYLRGLGIYDTHEKEPERASASFRYTDESNRVVNLGYSFRRDDLDQTDIAFAWPVGERWHLLGRWNYDLSNGRGLEYLGGIEYESCCWRARAVYRRFISNTDGEFNNIFMAQLELKGFAKLGESLDRVLESGILGYDAD
jgi:LPS-assembly protein